MGIGVDLLVQALEDQGLSPSEIQKRVDEVTNIPDQCQDADSIADHFRKRRAEREKTTLTELEKRDKVFELINSAVRSGNLSLRTTTPNYSVEQSQRYVDLIYGGI